MKRLYFAISVLLMSTSPPLLAQSDNRLAVAAMARDTDTVSMLLAEQGEDVNALGPYETPALHWIVHIEDLALAERLLTAGADPNLRSGTGLSPLSLAIETQNTEMVRL